MAIYVLGFLRLPESRIQHISVENVEAASIEDAVLNSKAVNGDNPAFTSKDLRVIKELKSEDVSIEVREEIYQYLKSWEYKE